MLGAATGSSLDFEEFCALAARLKALREHHNQGDTRCRIDPA
jgi:hypothetical protein